VSPKARGWILNLVRVAITAAAVVVVVRMIHWKDYWAIRADPQGKPTSHEEAEIREVAGVPGGGWKVTWADGRVTSAAGAVKQDGFIALFSHTNQPLFFAMLAAMLVPYYLLSLRWWLLLRGHGFDVPLGRVFFVTYAGYFFNNFLPGSVGGDLTKAILASAGEGRKAAIAGTIILDRVIGLAVMIVLGAASMTPFVSRFTDPRLAWLVYGLLGAMVVGYAVYFSPLFRKLIGVLPFRKTVEELDGVFRSAKEKKVLVLQAAALSLAAQAAGILIIYGLARAMGIPGIGLWMFFIFEPIIFIVTALPISVGGWGVQEFVYRELFGGFGGVDPAQAIALSVLYKLTMILASIPGGMLFAGGAARRRGGVPAPEVPGK
jgi:uncharacterized membrane protein YbhN (UPF0104 family)